MCVVSLLGYFSFFFFLPWKSRIHPFPRLPQISVSTSRNRGIMWSKVSENMRLYHQALLQIHWCPIKAGCSPPFSRNYVECLFPAACFHNTGRSWILTALPSLASLDNIWLSLAKVQRLVKGGEAWKPVTVAQVSFLSKVRLQQTITSKISYISQIRL